MNNFFGSQLSQEELQRLQRSQSGHPLSAQPPPQSARYGTVPGPPANPDVAMIGAADSIDDIVQNNSAELRRRSLPQPHPHFQPHTAQADADRRMSMMEFGGGDGLYHEYRYGAVPNSPVDPMNSGFPSLPAEISGPEATAAFAPPTMLTDDFSNLSPDMMGNMIAFSNMNMGQMDMGQMAAGDPSMAMYPAPSISNTFSPVDPTDFNMGLQDANAMECTPSGNGPIASVDGDATLIDVPPQFPQSSQTPSQQGVVGMERMSGYPSGISSQPSAQMSAQNVVSSAPSYQPSQASAVGAVRDESVSQQQASQTRSLGPQPNQDENKTIYSKSGFDMLKALWKVHTRKKPQVHLGAVDMSCAFVVCDLTQNDCPIIYVSDNFQNLTGYSRHDIVGKNCRFLQSPDGLVEAGTKREFVDNGAVYNLKVKIAECKEVQQSLINYRKGGKPFLNLLTMIPIPWDNETDFRYIIGFQIDLVECPDAIASSQGYGTMKIDYKQGEGMTQYIWNPPPSSQWEPENGQTLGVDDVSTLLQQYNPKGTGSDWHKQSWDKMLLENADDVVHVLSLKGLFLYLSPSSKRVLEYDAVELVGTSISSICHPSDIVPLTRELKDTTSGNPVNIVFRIRRKQSGYTWFESHGSLFVEQGKGRKCIILIGRKRPVFALSRRELELRGGIGDGELWTKLSVSGMFLFVSANVRSLLDLQPENLVGTSIQELMRKESRVEFGRSIEKARRGRTVTCKHEVQNRRGQVLQAQTILYPGDASEGSKPTFLLAQTKLLKASSRGSAGSAPLTSRAGLAAGQTPGEPRMANFAVIPGVQVGDEQQPADTNTTPGNQDRALASDDNIFDELKTTRCTSWQYELRQMEKVNRVLAEELHGLLSNKKKRKRRKGVGNVIRDCANCHTRNTPEWRRGPSGQRDLCNSCGLRWAKQTGRVSPRNSSRGGGDTASKKSSSPVHASPLHQELSAGEVQRRPSEAKSTPTLTRSSTNSSMPTRSSSTGVTPPAIMGMSMPPPSQPLLEGGVNSNEMTAIQEEREVS
ncbi:PAS domain-containing protein [Xylaria bambusicola]|uniref:PAS domain-containing protein n=1 Tax=Xylaria bambusicola TaxID=326684 RepID=UPI00200877DE|nr:PAS domain-containing protein [Xylaria bambusicola]KAI0503322.1 PAS domain-containing protein [Xylaria bambusicola]